MFFSPQAAKINQQMQLKNSTGSLCASMSPPPGRTEEADEHSSHHGSTAAAQAEVKALQDALRRRPQRRRDRRAQEGDAGRPN